MADNLLDEWIERVEAQCDEAEKEQIKTPDKWIMLTSTAPPTLWRARIRAIRLLKGATDAKPAPPAPAKDMTKEWCLEMAQREGDAEVGAGIMAFDPQYTPAKENS